MRKIMTWIVIAPLGLVAVVFMAANRVSLALDLWPLPFTVDAPLFAVILASVLIGLIWGGFAAWVSAGSWRRLARARGDRLVATEREVKRLKEKVAALEASQNTTKTALPAPPEAA